MTNRKVASISTIVSLMIVTVWQSLPSSVQASKAAPAATIQDAAPPVESAAPIWEYKILVFSSVAASRQTLGFVGPASSPYAPRNLEDEINKLAAQGFVVERLQTETAPGYAGYFDGNSEIVVLLKRARK